MMLTFLAISKTKIMHLGIKSIIHDLFPGAILSHADSREECLRLLAHQKVSLMISDGTVDNGLNLGMIRDVRALQPDIKIIMLMEDMTLDCLRLTSLAGDIDMRVRKSASIERIHEAILQVLPEAHARSL